MTFALASAMMLASVALAAPAPAPAAPPAPQDVREAREREDERADGSFLLVTRDAQVREVRLAAINDQSIVIMDAGPGWVTLDLRQCVALLGPDSAAAESSMRPARGMIVLADGQRLPGEAVTGATSPPDTLAWNHPWLGRVDVSFNAIASVLLTADAVAPAPGDADVVLTANGDKQEGFVTAIGENITLDVGEGANRQTVAIPLDRVTAITMIAPRQPGTGRRVWFTEGTVLDVKSIAVGDDGYVRMTGGTLLDRNGDAGSVGANQPSSTPPRVGLSDIAAMLFDRDALLPLASLTPSRVEGPATRYVLPKPTLLNPDAALGLSAIDFSGPLVTRYALPAGCERFIAEAELPRDMRAWGDCELIVRSDDAQVFRARLNAMTPTAAINVPLPDKKGGRELTIEVTAGAHGPIQDLVRLHRPMLLKGK